MLDGRHDLPLCRTVSRQLISRHDTWWTHLLLQQLAQQALGCALIAPALNQNVEHDAVLVDRAPQPVAWARNRDEKRFQATRRDVARAMVLFRRTITALRHAKETGEDGVAVV